MNPETMLTLLTFVFTGVLIAISLIVLAFNIWYAIRFFTAPVDESAGSLHGVAWLISFIGWWTGPLVVIMAPLSMILGWRARSGAAPGTRVLIASQAAFWNGLLMVIALVFALAFTAMILFATASPG